MNDPQQHTPTHPAATPDQIRAGVALLVAAARGQELYDYLSECSTNRMRWEGAAADVLSTFPTLVPDPSTDGLREQMVKALTKTSWEGLQNHTFVNMEGYADAALRVTHAYAASAVHEALQRLLSLAEDRQVDVAALTGLVEQISAPDRARHRGGLRTGG